MNNRQIRRWHLFPDKNELVVALRSKLLLAAEEAIEKQGRFTIVLAGGETPTILYRTLVDAKTDWNAWHIYFGDERCLPKDDPQRNDFMAKTAWLNHVSIPSNQINNIPAELGAEEGAKQYHERLSNVATFDLVLLGLGEDGHTASLFPNGEATYATENTIAVINAPKAPLERISLTAQRLGQTDELFFIVTGSNKQNAVQQWRNNEQIPAAKIQPDTGRADVFLDALAAN
ncbi:6-phosphogluconolactonase [Pseudomonadota bacterium]